MTPFQPFTIGEITVAGPTIRAPGVVMPLAGSQWHIVDVRITRTFIHPATIAIAVIIGMFTCLLGLLLLLIKTTTREGNVRVSVSNGSLSYTTELPVPNEAYMQWVHGMVMHARQLSTYA